jgi:DNA-binding SARP family transcriptional activator/tetratricopeptide (TPR) repeat protein
MEFRILGPLEVLPDGRPLDLGAQKRVLLALLVLDANRVVPSERLIDALWDEDPPETARKALQVHVSQLRKLLGRDRIATAAPGYRLRVEPGELDLERFRKLQDEGRFEEALGLWRGAALADLAGHHLFAPEASRLEELRLACQEERVERELAAGRHAELVPELEALVARYPLRERLRGQLMLALYRAGRQADALDAYRAVRRLLVDELGIEPGRALRELHQAILEQFPELDLGPQAAESAAETGRGVFVGREQELAELVAGLEEASAGRGRLFLLGGEPGIGKSRLAEELIREARARGMRVLVGRCWEAGGAPAYWPWVQSLRAFVRDADTASLRPLLGAGAAELAQIVPELRDAVPNLPEPASPDAEGARFRLFEATAQFLRSASSSCPILVVLDDLHAADAPSLLMLRYLARELGAMRVVILAAYRDIDPLPDETLAATLTELAREPVTGRMSLAGLTRAELTEYVELSAPDAVPPELVEQMHEDTEGNPLFAGEIVRLQAVEAAGPDRGRRLAIPQSVHDVIGRRLRHLSDECRRVLALASVFGREFALDVLARAAAVSEDELLDLLDEAMAARVVSDVPGARGRLRFAHVLIRDTLYLGLTPARRARLHRLVVDTLEMRYGTEPGPHLAELAHHAIAGSDFERGARYARRAADRALDLLAFEESARLYRAAVEALGVAAPADEATRCELLISLGDAEARGGATEAAEDAFAEAAEIADRLGLIRELARAALSYGGRMDWSRAGHDPRRVPLLERALARLPADELELRARVLGRLAGALRDEHSPARRDALSAEAVELAREAGDPAALASALSGRAAAICAPDSARERLAIGAEVSEVAARGGDLERVVAGHMHRVIALLQLSEVGEARAALAAAGEVAERLAQPAQLWEVGGGWAMLELAAGRLDQAEELAARAFEIGRHTVPDAAFPVYHLQRCALRDFRGGLEASVPELEWLNAEYPARPVFRCALAYVHARLGDPRAGEALALLARDGFSAIPFDQEWLFATSLLAETCSLVGDARTAAAVYDLMLPWADCSVSDPAEGFRGAVARDLGLLATALGRFEEAERHFEAALAMNSEMGALPWLARTRESYARMLLARGASGDRERSRELVADALAGCREMGMAPGFTAP